MNMNRNNHIGSSTYAKDDLLGLTVVSNLAVVVGAAIKEACARAVLAAPRHQQQRASARRRVLHPGGSIYKNISQKNNIYNIYNNNNNNKKFNRTITSYAYVDESLHQR